MLSMVSHRCLAIALVDGIEIGIGARVQEEVCAGPCRRVRRVIVVDVVGVEQLPCVIGVVTSLLQPDGEIVVV